MKKTKIAPNQMVIYQAPNGAIELRGDVAHETIWATQTQIALAFGVDVRTINEHIKNIYATDELSEGPTIRNFRIVQSEGNRRISRDIKHYNLDMIVSVGYRVNSKRATLFRQWATKTLREHIVKGYTINRKRIGRNYDSFMRAVDSVRELLPAGMKVDTGSILELIKIFAETWVSLDAYDKQVFGIGKVTKKKVTVAADELAHALDTLRTALIKKGEASELFARERSIGSVEGIIGSVMQGFGGKDMYPSVEEKAAHLLYFMVKNHPFTDGNKRSGAFAFVWFLCKARLLDTKRLTPEALTALTLLIAESNPKDKDKMTGLVVLLLRRA